MEWKARKMTSAVRTNKSLTRGGFSLLEMMLVMVVALMIVGSAIGMLYYNRDETRLNDVITDVEMFAKRCRAVASLQQRPYALELTREGIFMMPYAEAAVSPDDRETIRLIAEEQALELGESTDPNVYHEVLLDDDMEIIVRRWSAGEWRPIGRGERHVWRFDPDGISEPVGVRFQMDNGNWISAYFHPLSAAMSDLEYSIE